MVRKNDGTDDRPIKWYAKWRNDDRPIEWYVKMTESIDHPRHDVDTETTDMRYSSIEWYAKTQVV